MSDIEIGRRLGEFTVESTVELPEYKGSGVLLRHDATGCRVFHLANDDPENVFGFAFKTVPQDSTGVAHIVEHTVLSGSQGYPLKDPFALLLKGSMCTFLNAFTYPDKTVYPAASIAERDLFNLLEVYGDAVFFPLLKAPLFRQEGHRLEFAEDDSLNRTGVVYNEMQGSLSTHDAVASDWAYRSLFPETPYRFQSGGDPREIPNLTYEEFVAFHHRYYHPSNTRIFLYGSIPTERFLDVLHERFLSRFSRIDVPADLPDQPRWSEPRSLTESYPAADESTGSSVTVNWLLSPVTDREQTIAFDILGEALLGNAGSPLYRALIESHLGEDLSAPTGLETDLRNLVFSVGLRGTRPERASEIESLIFSELKRYRDDGLPDDLVTGALRRIEFANREIHGGTPRGIRLMLRSLRGWLHDAPPETTLRFDRPMEEVKKRLAENPRMLQEMIDRWLVENPHRSTVTVVPDTELRNRRLEALHDELAQRRSAMTDADHERLAAEASELADLQNTPDDPEAVARVPFLKRADVPREVNRFAQQDATLLDRPALLHPVDANRIVYVDLSFDLSAVEADDLPFVPLFCSATTEMGLPGVPYYDVARKQALVLGGFRVGAQADMSVSQRTDRQQTDPQHTDSQHGELRRSLHVRFKALEDSLEEGAALAGQMVAEADFTDGSRLHDIYMEQLNGLRSAIVPRGTAYAAARSARGFSPADAVSELWTGVSQYLFLSDHSNDDPEAIAAVLERIRRAVVCRATLVSAVGGDEPSEWVPTIERALSVIPVESSGGPAIPPPSPNQPEVEGIAIPADVGYVALTIPGPHYADPSYAYQRLMAHLLSTGSLWEAVRMKGGAYGVFASGNGLHRTFSFGSYRDPNILPTLAAYRKAIDEVAAGAISDDDLDLAVIAVLGRELKPKAPGEINSVGLRRRELGITDDHRQAVHDRMRTAGASDLRRAAEELSAGFEEGVVVVMGPANSLDDAATALPGLKANRVELAV